MYYAEYGRRNRRCSWELYGIHETAERARYCRQCFLAGAGPDWQQVIVPTAHWRYADNAQKLPANHKFTEVMG